MRLAQAEQPDSLLTQRLACFARWPQNQQRGLLATLGSVLQQPGEHRFRAEGFYAWDDVQDAHAQMLSIEAGGSGGHFGRTTDGAI
jgi:hypothetical protein